MTRRWWSAISPQLGRSALDISPFPSSLPFLFSLLTCPLISSSYMRFTFSLCAMPLLPSPSIISMATFLISSSLFLTPRLDILLYVCVVPGPLSLFSPLCALPFSPSSMSGRLLVSRFNWNMSVRVSTAYERIFLQWELKRIRQYTENVIRAFISSRRYI